MSELTRPARKGARAYFAANIVAQAAALLRYVILARLLGAEELGLAAMLILTAQFFDSISDTGSDRFLVQDPEGDTPLMQGFVQLVLAGRGVFIAIGLALTSGLLAQLYHAPALRVSLLALTIPPLIGGLVHLDLRRVQRVNDFRPESLAIMISEIAGLTATAAAAYVTRDHTSVIYGLAARALALVGVSHLTAKRPYRWAWAREQGMRFSLFAMPLFVNGLLLFFGGQGDRLIVGNGLGAAALGQYSAVLLLVYYPAAMLGRFITGIHLPLVAGGLNNPETFARESDRLAGRTLLLSTAVFLGFAVVAPVATPLLYGKGFGQPLQIFAMLGVLQASRLLRFWPTTLAVGIGKSGIVTLNNVARTIALPVAYAANLAFHSLEAIVAGFILGEIAAMQVLLSLLARDGAVEQRSELTRVGAFLGVGAATIAFAWCLQAGHYMVLIPIGLAGAAVLAVLLRNERPTLEETLRVVRARVLPRLMARAR